jgi:hypothetical protein
MDTGRKIIDASYAIRLLSFSCHEFWGFDVSPPESSLCFFA